MPAALDGYRPGSAPTGAHAPGATGAYAPGATGAYAAPTSAYGTRAYATGATGAFGASPRHGSGPGTGAYATGAYNTGQRPSGGPSGALGTASGTLGTASGTQPVLETASGTQPVLGSGSGAQSVLGPGSGPLRALDRDPARGFPPRGAQQEHAADSWYRPPGGYAPAPVDNYPPPTADSYPPPTAGYPPPTADRYPPPAADSYPPPTAGRYPPPDDEYDYAPDDEPGPTPVRASRRRLFRNPVVIGVVAVLILAALGAAGYKLVYEPRQARSTAENALKLPATDVTASNPYITKNGVIRWGHIQTRKEDPTPLSLDELFYPAFTISGSEYLKATASITKTCGDAVFGDLIQAALQEGDCSQLARASYVSGNGEIMGTIGVASLSSAYQAGKADKTASSTELIAPLTTAKGATRRLLTGTGLAYAEVKGHYLILLYAEFTSTKTPKTAAEKQDLVAFCEGMFKGSADIALSHRMLYGKP